MTHQEYNRQVLGAHNKHESLIVKVKVKSLTGYSMDSVAEAWAEWGGFPPIAVGSVYEGRYIPPLDPQSPEVNEGCVIIKGYYIHLDDVEFLP